MASRHLVSSRSAALHSTGSFPGAAVERADAGPAGDTETGEVFKVFFTVWACSGGTTSEGVTLHKALVTFHLEVTKFIMNTALHVLFVLCYKGFSYSFAACYGYYVFSGCEAGTGFHHLVNGRFRVWRECPYDFFTIFICIGYC